MILCGNRAILGRSSAFVYINHNYKTFAGENAAILKTKRPLLFRKRKNSITIA